ncbi:MAG: FKBP-type peptidyl-prolyl cis-trans isomerase [Bacteroidota bacterium]
MKIGKDKVVGIHYTLKDNSGNVLDSSVNREPLQYLHGHGNIIPGLEEALEGKQPEDNLTVTVQPEKAYGKHNKEMVYTMDRSKFDDPQNIQKGMQFQAQFDEGTQLLTVIDIKGDDIVLDANHPLAGRVLNFDVEVTDVREASKEEIDHGHVHGEGGHQH